MRQACKWAQHPKVAVRPLLLIVNHRKIFVCFVIFVVLVLSGAIYSKDPGHRPRIVWSNSLRSCPSCLQCRFFRQTKFALDRGSPIVRREKGSATMHFSIIKSKPDSQTARRTSENCIPMLTWATIFSPYTVSLQLGSQQFLSSQGHIKLVQTNNI